MNETNETHKDLQDSSDDTISVRKPSPAKKARPKTAKQIVRVSEDTVGDTIETMYAQRKSFADCRLLKINKKSKETELNEMHIYEVLDKQKTYFASLKLQLQPPLTQRSKHTVRPTMVSNRTSHRNRERNSDVKAIIN